MRSRNSKKPLDVTRINHHRKESNTGIKGICVKRNAAAQFWPSPATPAACSDTAFRCSKCGICESSYLFTVYSCVTLKLYFRKVKQPFLQPQYCWGSYPGAAGSEKWEFGFCITFYPLHRWNQHVFHFSTGITDNFRQVQSCYLQNKVFSEK